MVTTHAMTVTTQPLARPFYGLPVDSGGTPYDWFRWTIKTEPDLAMVTTCRHNALLLLSIVYTPATLFRLRLFVF